MSRPHDLLSMIRIGVSVILAAVICLAAPSPILAQNKTPAKPKPALDKAAVAELKLKEANVLREAYVALAAANHDYDGHRAKAMNQLQAAVKVLDEAVAKNGSAAAKAASAYENAVAAQAKRAAKATAPVHEDQRLSDAQLRKAAQMLADVRPSMNQVNQPVVLGHVDNAIKQLGIALKIR